MQGLIATLTVSLALAAQGGAAPKHDGDGKTQLTWYGHSAFVLRTPAGTVIAIDPWLSNPKARDPEAAAKLDKVDFILVSHGHFDHVGDAVAIAKRTNARFVGAFELAQALQDAGYPMDPQTMLATAGNIGGTIALGDDASVTLVPAVHSSGFKKDAQAPGPPAYGGNPVGFLIHVKGGPTIYDTGDTDVFGDMKLIADGRGVDLMLACIGGHFTMDPARAAQAAVLAGAKVVVPMHFGTFPVLSGTPAELQRALKGKARVLEMKVGETRSF